MEKSSKNKTLFFIQTIFSGLLAIIGIITIFNNSFFPYLEILLGLNLLLLAYNNQRIFHKQKMTVMYIVFGVIVILVGILSLLGVM